METTLIWLFSTFGGLIFIVFLLYIRDVMISELNRISPEPDIDVPEATEVSVNDIAVGFRIQF